MSFKLTWKSHVICSLISIGMVLIIKSTFDNIMINYMQIFISSDRFILKFFMSIIILMVPISIVHEAIHGAVYKLFGGKIKYGFKGIYAYTKETSGKEILRVEFLMVLLAPLTVMSVLSLLLTSWLGAAV